MEAASKNSLEIETYSGSECRTHRKKGINCLWLRWMRVYLRLFMRVSHHLVDLHRLLEFIPLLTPFIFLPCFGLQNFSFFFVSQRGYIDAKGGYDCCWVVLHIRCKWDCYFSSNHFPVYTQWMRPHHNVPAHLSTLISCNSNIVTLVLKSLQCNVTVQSSLFVLLPFVFQWKVATETNVVAHCLRM